MNRSGRFVRDIVVKIVKFVIEHYIISSFVSIGLFVSISFFIFDIDIQKKFVKLIPKIFVTPIIEEKQYEKEIASLRTIINHLNARIDTMHEQRDSVYSSISSLQANLNSVTNKFESFYNEHTSKHIQQNEIDTLRSKIATVADSFTTKVTELETSIDSLNDEFDEHTTYSAKMDSTLKENVRDIREQRDIMLAVHVFVGTEDTLKQQGYLSTPRFMLLFRQNYKIKNFPDSTNSKIDTVYIGKSFPVPGKLIALCNYDGKLHEGKDYTVSKGQLDTTHVVLSRSMIAGHRILAVLKN